MLATLTRQKTAGILHEQLLLMDRNQIMYRPIIAMRLQCPVILPVISLFLERIVPHKHPATKIQTLAWKTLNQCHPRPTSGVDRA